MTAASVNRLLRRNTLSPSTIFRCFLLWIPFILLLPIIFLILSLLAIYKAVVITLWKLSQRHDLISPVSGLDVMFSTDDHFKRPYGSLAFVWFVDGPVSSGIIRNRLQTVLVSPSSSPPHFNSTLSGSVDRYEKLTSVYPTFWLGYPFWKRTRSKFDISHHVKVMKLNRSSAKTHFPEFITHLDDINKLICDWMTEPFSEGRPLWEIRIIPQITFLENTSPDLSRDPDLGGAYSVKIHGNTVNAHQVDAGRDETATQQTNEQERKKVKSILVLKTHHMLGDGISMLRLLDNIVDSPERPSTQLTSQTYHHRYTNEKCSKVENRKQTVQPPQPSPTKNLQCNQNEQVIKIGKVTDQQGKEKYARLGNKSLDFTATYYVSNPDDNAAEAVKFQGRKFVVEERDSKCKWLWYRLRLTVAHSWHQLFDTIYFALFIPSSIFSFVNQFVLHRDYWFTQKKDSTRTNMATVSISMERLNTIRNKLCKKRTGTLHVTMNALLQPPNLQGTGHYDANEKSRKSELPKKYAPSPLPSVPIIVMAVAAFAGALQNLLVGKRRKLEGELSKSSKSKPVSGENMEESKIKSYFKSSVGRSTRATTNGSKSFVNFIVALPLQEEHPGRIKFCNFWTHGILQTNLQEQDTLRRLRQLNKFYWEMRSQQKPEIYHSLVKFYSLFPKPILSFLSNYNMGSSIGVTNMADSPEAVFIGGRKVYRKYAYFGLQWRHASLTLALLSYNGELTATILANEKVVPDQATVEKLLRQYFLREIELLTRRGLS